MSHNEHQYLVLLEEVLRDGQESVDRTGVGTLSVFGTQTRYDLTDSFPLLTSKRIYWKGVVGELLWFLSGNTNIKYLTDNNIHIWDAWADQEGNLGPVYGKQWRDFNGVDQIANLIEGIKSNPTSRRHIVSAWNPVDVPQMALPPCHTMFQVNVQGDFIDLQLYQRSADLFLGVPFNIASYSLLLHMIADQTGYKPRHFIHTTGDTHIYLNHVKQVEEQLNRYWKSEEGVPDQPLLVTRRKESIFDYTLDDFLLIDYNPLPAIKAEVAV